MPLVPSVQAFTALYARRAAADKRVNHALPVVRLVTAVAFLAESELATVLTLLAEFLTLHRLFYPPMAVSVFLYYIPFRHNL